MSEITKAVKAKKVREGDFLTGLDDGYVFTEPERVDGPTRFNEVIVRFHDADGEENLVQCGKNMRITVRRSTS
jgi:hypothetical protein